MKSLIRILILTMLSLVGHAQATTFTYQGQLSENGSPATNTYDFQFILFDAATGGTQVGVPNLVVDWPVTDGIFQLSLDFNVVLANADYWLEIGVRPGNSTDVFTILNPRQYINYAPRATYAYYSTSAITATVSDTAYDGPFWYLNGNIGSGHFLGTTDNNPLELRVNNQRVGVIVDAAEQTISNSFHAPNVLLGSMDNVITAAYGATIAGGGGAVTPDSSSYLMFCGDGSQPCVNTVSGVYGTVSGGSGNYASGPRSTVGGGYRNTASMSYTTVSGGYKNTANGLNASVGGGKQNTASSYATVGGGEQNIASGGHSAVPGGFSNLAGGSFSFAGGYQAMVRDAASVGDADGDEGTFVWADYSNATFTSTGPNQFLVRASGGVGLGTNNPNGHQLNVLGSTFLRNSTDTSTAADLVLGGSSGNASDDGVLTTDLSIAGSDLIIRSNDAVVVVLDNDTTSDGSFTVRDGSGTDLLLVAGNGNVTIPGNLTVSGTITGTLAKKGGALPAPEEQLTADDLYIHQIQQLQQKVAWQQQELNALKEERANQEQQLAQLQQVLQAVQSNQQLLLKRLREGEIINHSLEAAQ